MPDRTVDVEDRKREDRDREDLRLADAERLSSAPAEEPPPGGAAGRPDGAGPAGIGLVGWLRWFWRQLTSMRVALLLLFLLSLAAIPGSLVPQESVDPMKVDAFVAEHGTLAPVYDRLGLFSVYSSVWFSAIYILLFVSLAGCILPRSWQFVGTLRGRPPAAPRNLSRLPVYTTWETGADPDAVLAAAGRALRRRRFRTHAADGAVSSEKGYLREAGNLLFHISLFGLLIAVAAGHLWQFSGGKLIVEGDGFSNTLTQYDDFTPGPLYDVADLDAFGFRLDDFQTAFATRGSQRGTARKFEADVRYWEGADGAEKSAKIKVNEPLEIGDSKVFLIGHGYAPVVTVRDGQGDIAFRGPVPCLPLDGNVTSNCVIKVPDAMGKDGKKDQLAFAGIFAPTARVTPDRGPHSIFPGLLYPAMYLTAYHGSLGIDSGLSQSVYQLDRTKMEQFADGDGEKLRGLIRPEERIELPDGAGSLTFDGVRQWASFQVSRHPGNGTALASAVLAILGLVGSLFVQRRRVWVRVTEDAHGRTVVEMAGLARGESARTAGELAGIAVELQADAPPAAPDGTVDHRDAEPERAACPEPGAGPEMGTGPATDAGTCPPVAGAAAHETRAARPTAGEAAQASPETAETEVKE